jgi:PAS domain S-box-containing protein
VFEQRISVERLGRMVEEAASEVYLFSAEDFRFVLVNRGARENLGYTMDELRDLTPWDIKPEVPRERFLELVEPLISRSKRRLDFQTVHQRKDGSRYPVSVRLQLIESEGLSLFYAAIQDTTFQAETERALRETTARLDAILSNTTMAVFMMDARQHCVFMNAAAEQLTGYTFAETQGRPLHDVVHHTYPDGRPFPINECAIDRAFPENNKTQGEEVFVHKDGSFYPVGFTASPMKDQSGRTIGTIIEARNIAAELEARKALEAFNETLQTRIAEALDERQKLEAQLVQAQKMEAVGQLTGGIAHDFNNLLQVISGNLQLLQRELGESDPLQRRVRNALAGVRRGADLASQLLSFGRQQTLAPKPVNFGKLVRGMDDMLRRTLGEAIEIETIVAGGLWNCMADQSQLENLLLNLAINARDAMNGVGKLTIEAGNARLDDAYVETQTDLKSGQYVMLAVTDTGRGIPSDIRDRVFDPFFTTKKPGDGTGLGLSMVYGFVKQSGGHINIYSEEGQGTTFRVYLPRTRLADDLPVEINEATGQVGGAETILVVEDDDAVRETTIELLRAVGYQILEASNADNALVIINSGVHVDLLFTDVIMPGQLRSTELARKARQRLPHLRVLFTSGYTQNAIAHSGKLDEGVELIAKPFTSDGLAQKIRQVLGPAKAQPEVSSSVDSQSDQPVPSSGATKLRVLVVEDEALISLMLAEMLQELGCETVEAATLLQARERLANDHFDVLITDLGLPDGSGLDLIKEVGATQPDLSIILSTGGNPDAVLPPAGWKGVTILGKPFSMSALSSALAGLRDKNQQ